MPKSPLETAAHQRVQAIGRDDQVVPGKLIHRIDRRVVSWRDADRANPLLQDREQLEPADRGEADAVDLDALAAQIEGDVLPALHPRRDGVDRVGVVGAQEFQRLFGEHHAKAPGGSGGILLEQVDIRVRMPLFPQIGEIEASGASADHGDTHSLLPIDSILFILSRLVAAGQSRQRKISGGLAVGRISYVLLLLRCELAQNIRACRRKRGCLRGQTLYDAAAAGWNAAAKRANVAAACRPQHEKHLAGPHRPQHQRGRRGGAVPRRLASVGALPAAGAAASPPPASPHRRWPR